MRNNIIGKIITMEESIFSAVEDYIENISAYTGEIVLAINPKTKEVNVDESKNLKNDDAYNINTLVRNNENGEMEPDIDEVKDITSKYFFVK